MRKRIDGALRLLCALFTMFLISCGGGGGGGSNPSGGTGTVNNQVSSVVSTHGGTILVSDTTSPINGFKMVIPANALSTDTTVTVQTTNKTIPLPQAVSITDSIIELLPAGQIFSKPISITIPYSGNTPPTVVTYNSASSSYSILPISSIDIQNKTITVITNHFTTVAKINSNAAYPSIGTNFKLGVDTFKIDNSPTVFDDGVCWGFSYYSQWYFKNKKASDGNLYGKYAANEFWIVSEAQATQSDTIILKDALLARFYNKLSWHDEKTFQDLYNAMLINNSPQVLLVADPTDLSKRSHAVLVYAINKLSNGTWQLDINDNRDNSRNYPLIFDGQHFQTWHGCTKVNNYIFTWFTFVGDDAVSIRPALEAIYNKYKDKDSSHTISGRVTLNGSGLAGATVTLSGSGTSSMVTDSNGGYTFMNAVNGTYSITALKAGYNFTPFSISNIVVNGTNVLNQNFTANVTNGTYYIRGTIHSGNNTGPVLPGATVSIAGKTATTSSTGTFSIAGISSGTHAFSVSKSGYDTYTNPAYYVGSNQTGLSFYLTQLQPTFPYFTMSGTIHAVSNSGPALSGVTVSIAGRTATSNSTGAFTITGISAGTHSFSVSKPGYDTYTNPAYYVGSNQTGLSFYLTQPQPTFPYFTMSGTIHAVSNSGPALSGVTVSFAGKTAITSSTGAFYITGIPSGTYAFSVSKAGFDTYTNPAYYIGVNQANLNFYLIPSPPFGALAINYSTGSAGLSGGYSDIELAIQRALQECGVGCSIVGVYGKNTCAAYAKGDSGGSWWGGYSYGYTPLSEAISGAMNECNLLGPGCTVKLSWCNY